MSEVEKPAESNTGKENAGGKVLLVYLLIGIAFPALFIAFISVWELLVMLLAKLAVPKAAGQVVAVIGIVASLAGSFLCCREIWRRRPR